MFLSLFFRWPSLLFPDVFVILLAATHVRCVPPSFYHRTRAKAPQMSRIQEFSGEKLIAP